MAIINPYWLIIIISQLTVFELSPLDAMPGGKICMWLWVVQIHSKEYSL